ncbi:MAG: SurA N-terminal domain-containing protein, partial [Candidatus Dependentiae bacterium]|nr:SurA N-terminal domain-containing protein [Candidatus Dependentiae bacterium]
MIMAIRRSFKSKAYKIILWIVILAMAGIFTLPELFKMGRTASWIAKINKQKISPSDFMRKATMHQQYMAIFREKYGQSADLILQSMGINLDPQVFAFDAVVQEALLNQAAQKIGIVISPEYVEEKLANPLFVRQELSDLI